MPSRNPFDKFFSVKKIGTGSEFEEGEEKQSGTSPRFAKGLRGAFYKAKWSGGARRTLTKNLSNQDIDFIDRLIGPSLRALPKNADGLSLWQRKKLKHEVFTAFKAGHEHLSQTDCDDAYNIIDSLRDHHLEALRSRTEPGINNGSATRSQSSIETNYENPLIRLQRTNDNTIDERDSLAEESSNNTATPPPIIKQNIRLPEKPREKDDNSEMDIG
ncbi:MAG: hypothetical protein WC817_04390 [Patescibacteria group bacterium]